MSNDKPGTNQTAPAANGKRARKAAEPMTKAKAAAQIGKILAQLPEAQRASVLAFVGGE